MIPKSEWKTFGVLLLAALWCGPARAAEFNPGREDGDRVTDEIASDAAVAPDGSVYVSGYGRDGTAGEDFIILKLDREGRTLWKASWDGEAHGADFARALAVDARGRVWVTGSSAGPGASLDAVTLIYDGGGRLLRTSRFNGPAGRDDDSERLVLGPDGSATAAGSSFGDGTEHDFLVIHYNPNGGIDWTARHNPPQNRDDYVRALARDGEGNLFVTGLNRVAITDYDWATLKFSPDGRRLWLAGLSGPGGVFDEPTALAVDSQGGVAVTGYGYRDDEEYNIVTVLYDPEGNLMWRAEYDGPADRADRARAVAVDDGGNVYVAGESRGTDTAMDIVVLKYDANGKLQWEERYDGPAGKADTPCALELDPRSDLLIAGTSRSREGGRDFLLLKLDRSGGKIWEFRKDIADDETAALAVDGDGGSLIAGTSREIGAGADILVFKVDREGGLLWENRHAGPGGK